MQNFKTHEYFKRDPSKWNVLEFLNECVTEPFDSKVDAYLKSLENINCNEQGTRQERAKELIETYREESNFLGYRQKASC
jgi:hypothetical protein